MYIPYDSIGNIFYKLFRFKFLNNFCYKRKVIQNIKYIEKNYPNVVKKLKKKFRNNEKLRVIFYVYDETKWKCQSVYDEFNRDERFEVKIIATKTAATNADNPSFQTIEDVKRVYSYFQAKGMNVEYGYDTEQNKFIAFKDFAPDIIFYQHPWYVERSQGPVVCSKFALTAYVPYFFQIEANKIDYYLRFHQYIEKFYIIDEFIKKQYAPKMENNGKNLVVVGYPLLDTYKVEENKNDLIIYAPHWTVGQQGVALSTFEWSGKFLLEYAKTSGKQWIFKPHPLLFKALIDNNIFTKEEAQKYYDEWNSVGLKYEGGDYLELFAKSSMMITDSSSFLGEYFVTDKPLIHLLSEKSQFRDSENPILKAHYRVENIEELKNILNELPINDYKKIIRKEMMEQINLGTLKTSKKIFDDILKTIHS